MGLELTTDSHPPITCQAQYTVPSKNKIGSIFYSICISVGTPDTKSCVVIAADPCRTSRLVKNK